MPPTPRHTSDRSGAPDRHNRTARLRLRALLAETAHAPEEFLPTAPATPFDPTSPTASQVLDALLRMPDAPPPPAGLAAGARNEAAARTAHATAFDRRVAALVAEVNHVAPEPLTAAGTPSTRNVIRGLLHLPDEVAPADLAAIARSRVGLVVAGSAKARHPVAEPEGGRSGDVPGGSGAQLVRPAPRSLMSVSQGRARRAARVRTAFASAAALLVVALIVVAITTAPEIPTLPAPIATVYGGAGPMPLHAQGHVATDGQPKLIYYRAAPGVHDDNGASPNGATADGPGNAEAGSLNLVLLGSDQTSVQIEGPGQLVLEGGSVAVRADRPLDLAVLASITGDSEAYARLHRSGMDEIATVALAPSRSGEAVRATVHLERQRAEASRADEGLVRIDMKLVQVSRVVARIDAAIRPAYRLVAPAEGLPAERLARFVSEFRMTALISELPATLGPVLRAYGLDVRKRPAGDGGSTATPARPTVFEVVNVVGSGIGTQSLYPTFLRVEVLAGQAVVRGTTGDDAVTVRAGQVASVQRIGMGWTAHRDASSTVRAAWPARDASRLSGTPQVFIDHLTAAFTLPGQSVRAADLGPTLISLEAAELGGVALLGFSTVNGARQAIVQYVPGQGVTLSPLGSPLEGTSWVIDAVEPRGLRLRHAETNERSFARYTSG